MTYSNADVEMLDSLSYADLETMKRQLDTMRQRIIALQNAQSLLFRLPGELRNKIFLFAMYGELQERKQRCRHSIMFKEPAFFATNRQIKVECTGVWFNDVLTWEEWVNVSGELSERQEPQTQKDDIEMIEDSAAPAKVVDCTGTTKVWRKLGVEQVKRMCSERSKAGKFTLVTQPAHCELGRTRESVESSRSICPRKGLVRVNGEVCMPQLRWWVW